VRAHDDEMATLTRSVAALAAALTILSVPSAAHARPVQVGATVLSTHLTHSGDPDGSGSATVRLRPGAGRVCASISWTGIDDPSAAHIHRASDGFVLVDLTGAVTGGSRCVDAPRAVIRRIALHPRRYYVNVHNATYPAGAVQGTLHR